MNYEDFQLGSARVDSAANDNGHYFSHHFASSFAFFFYKLGVSPNFVTWCFFALGCTSAILLWHNYPILAFLAWRLHIIVDMADGTLARATKTFSKSADGFDRSCHIVINTSVLFACTQLIHNDLVLLAILISFYLSYFFSRNYYLGKAKTHEFSLGKNILKDFLGFEGYIFFSCVILYYGATEMQIFLGLLYCGLFFSIYLVKLRLYFQSSSKL